MNGRKLAHAVVNRNQDGPVVMNEVVGDGGQVLFRLFLFVEDRRARDIAAGGDQGFRNQTR